MRLGIAEFIDCAHFLPGHPKCGQLHGHTYKVEVTIEGEQTGGMVIDFNELKARTLASPAPLEGALLLRTDKSLYRIADE